MSRNKIKTKTKLKEIIDSLKKDKKVVVFTNGCFDILHLGHIRYLEAARNLGDVLVVGLNADASVRKIKPPGRPINKQNDRAQVLASLECVDLVTIFNEETPLELIKLIKPDVLVKGGDWKEEDIVGAEFVKTYGGKVKTIKYIKGYSTTGLIDKINKSIKAYVE